MNLIERRKRKIEPINCRKIERNMMKIENQNNKIRTKWRLSQIHKYGISNWCRMYNHSACNNKCNYITPKDFARA